MSSGSGSKAKSIWTPSNVITIIRILLVPVFVAALLAPWPEWFGMNKAFSNDWKSIIAAAIFVLISCTDWLDGYLARSRNEITDFGKFMDPLADKILVAAALIALVELGSLPTWVVLVILAREFIVSGVRMMAASKGVVIAASMLGKFKTVFQMIAIVLFTIKDSHMIGSFGEAVSDVLWDVSWVVMLIAIGDSGQGDDESSGNVENESGSVFHLAEDARDLLDKARAQNKTIASAESLTGGMIGATLTSIAGSSDVFRGGVMSYTNEVKRDVLGVDAEILEREGAVCEQVAIQMAEGVRDALNSDFAVAVTGIAGPGGAEPGKPVGTVCFGFARKNGKVCSETVIFSGNRSEVREQAVAHALTGLLQRL